MLDIWVDIITLEILNMARDGYGLDKRLHNDYVDEIKKKTKDNILCFLAEHDAEIRRQAVEDFSTKVYELFDRNRGKISLIDFDQLLNQMRRERNE